MFFLRNLLSLLVGITSLNIGICFLLLVQGIWVACVPAIAALLLGSALLRPFLSSSPAALSPRFPIRRSWS